MVPAYKPGDHILTFNWASIDTGDAVVFKEKGRAYIKRVRKIVSGNYYVEGDNRLVSSRMGPVKKEQIVGKAVLKY